MSEKLGIDFEDSLFSFPRCFTFSCFKNIFYLGGKDTFDLSLEKNKFIYFYMFSP